MRFDSSVWRRRGLRSVWVGLALCATVVAGGCASRGRAAIASGARMVKEGRGTLTYTARDAGDVYVYNKGNGRLVYMGAVAKGQTVEVDPAADQVLVGGKVATSREIPDKDEYQIYYRYRVME